jgi:Polyketide cyclase / dehydrase and lipid transport
MTKKSTRWWLRTDSEDVVVAAPAEHIYDMVSDMPRMGEWSPECQKVDWIDGANGPVAGARFLGHNRGGPRGILKWSRRGRVLVAESGREFTFATEEGGKEGVIWHYRLEPTLGGTKVTESYEITTIPTWARIVDIPTNRARELRDGMRHTLANLKAAAEASVPADGR